MRIIAGRWAGTGLVSPAGRVRPTAEDVRRAWMDLLGDRLRDARVLDLFAGSGALGLEALSRGAVSADFVENGGAALHALKANLAKLGVRPPRRTAEGDAARARRSGRTRSPSAATGRVFKRDAIPFVEALPAGAYDLAFADPPYGSAKLDRVLAAWRERRFAAVIGAEHAADHDVPPGGKRLAFGDTAVTVWGLRGR